MIIKDSTVEKAIQKGLIKLNITKDEANITILNEGKKGLFGFGKQDAEIEISKKEIEKESISESIEKINIELDSKEKTIAESCSEDSDLNEDYENISEKLTDVCHFIKNVLTAYGVESVVTSKLSGKKLYVNIETDKVGLVIGKHGKIINALQILAQTIVYKDEEKSPVVVVNVGDYRKKREEKLNEIADRTAKKVLKTKQSVFLEPLPAFERKIIHARLSRYEQIKTHSEGKEPYRYLVVEFTK